MCCFKSGAICAFLASTLWLTGCASAASKAQSAEIKRNTIQRWTACLERNVDVRIMPAKQIDKLLNQSCEGHKRDVIALYPRNMADQIDQVLSSSALRYIESVNQSEGAAELPSKQVHTALR